MLTASFKRYLGGTDTTILHQYDAHARTADVQAFVDTLPSSRRLRLKYIDAIGFAD